MPGGALPGSAFLHQHMIVVEPHLRRSHQRRSDLRHAGVAGQPLDLRDVLPAAEVLSERTGITQAARHLGQRARNGQHDLDRGDRSGYLGRIQDAAHASDAVAGEGRGQFRVRLIQVHGYPPCGGDTLADPDRTTRNAPAPGGSCPSDYPSRANPSPIQRSNPVPDLVKLSGLEPLTSCMPGGTPSSGRSVDIQVRLICASLTCFPVAMTIAAGASFAAALLAWTTIRDDALSRPGADTAPVAKELPPSLRRHRAVAGTPLATPPKPRPSSHSPTTRKS